MTSSMNPRFRAIVFDLDGTLIDSYVALTRSINYARSRHGLDALNEEAIRGAVGDGVQALLERTFAPVAVPATAEADFESYYDEICCEESRVLEDVEETLATLATHGIRMGVCTNKPTAFSAKILGHVGLASHFDAIVGPDTAGARKPDGRHVRHTLEAMKWTAGEALFVGDMPVDVAAARDAGLPVAVLATGSSPRAALEAARPDYLLERFRDLLPLVVGEPKP